MAITSTTRVERNWLPTVIQTGAVITATALIALGYLQMRGTLHLKKINHRTLIGSGGGLLGAVALYQVFSRIFNKKAANEDSTYLPNPQLSQARCEEPQEIIPTNPFDTIPNELLVHIFSFLIEKGKDDPIPNGNYLRSLRALCFVNRRFKNVMTDVALWKKFIPQEVAIARGKYFEAYQRFKMNKTLYSSSLSASEPWNSETRLLSVAIDTHGNSGTFAIGRSDGRIELRDLKKNWEFIRFISLGTEVRDKLGKQVCSIEQLAFAPQNKLLAIHSNTIFVWDFERDKLIAHLSTCPNRFHSFAVSYKMNLLITGTSPTEGTISIWNLSTFQSVTVIRKPVFALQYDDVFDRIVSISNHGNRYHLDFWNIEGKKLSTVLIDQEADGSTLSSDSLKIEPKSKKIVFLETHTLQVRDLDTGSLIWSVSHEWSNPHELNCNRICINPKNRLIFSVESSTRAFYVWSLKSGRLISSYHSEYRDIDHEVSDLAFVPNSNEIIWTNSKSQLFSYGGFYCSP